MRNRLILVVVLGAMLTACTTVRVFKNNNVVQEHDEFLPSLPTDYQALALFRRGYGIFVDRNGVVFGKLDEQRVYMKDLAACQVVLFVENDEQVEKIQKLLCAADSSLSEVCVISNKQMRKKCNEN